VAFDALGVKCVGPFLEVHDFFLRVYVAFLVAIKAGSGQGAVLPLFGVAVSAGVLSLAFFGVVVRAGRFVAIQTGFGNILG